MEDKLPQQHDDELDVEELEEVAGGGAGLSDSDEATINNCPNNTNCPCQS